MCSPLPDLPQAQILATIALPFGEPFQVRFAPGRTIAEILEEAFTHGLIDRAWADNLHVHVGDQEVPREHWAHVKPKPAFLLGIRAHPGDPGTIGAFLVEFAINVAIAATVNAVLGAFAAKPDRESFEQLKDIDASSNEVALRRKVSVPLGTIRVWPCHGSKAFTESFGDDVYIRMLFVWGVAPLALDLDSLKIGETPIADFAGVEMQHKLTPSDPWPSLFNVLPDEDEGPGQLEHADGWVALTTTGDTITELQVETLWPEGLVRYKADGSSTSFDVEFRLRYRQQGDANWRDWETGAIAAEGAYYHWTQKSQKPFRFTHRRTGLSPARYEVAMKRVSLDPDHVNNKNWFQWTKLRGFANTPPVLDPNAAVTALRIKAGDQLSGRLDLFNGIVSRVAPIWDAEEEAFGPAAATSNPAELTHWIATGPGAVKPRTPGDETDLGAFGAWAELCTLRGWKCDHELRAGAGHDEIMALVARCGRAVLADVGGKLTPIVDDLQETRVQMFTPKNSWGFRAVRRYAPETHAYRAEFNNEAKDFALDEMVVPFPGYTLETAELIEALAVPGKTSGVEINRETKRAIAETIIRGEDYYWNADLENFTVKRGKRVGLAHFAIAVGRQPARVAGLVLNAGRTHVTHLELDEQVEQTPGDLYGIAWRRVEGDAISVEALALENTGETGRQVKLAAALPIASAPKVGDLVEFGDAEIETLDIVVTNIARRSKFEAELTGAAYTGDLFIDDDEPEPVWESNVSGEAATRPPKPVILGVSANAGGMFVNFGFAPGSDESPVRGVEGYWKLVDDDGAFELIATPLFNTRQVVFPAGERGRAYELIIVVLGPKDTRRASDPEEVISAARGVGLLGVLTNQSHIVSTASDGSGGSYTAAGGEFKIYLGGTDISTDFDVEYELVSATSGLTIAIDDETGAYAISALSVDNATATFRATLDGFDPVDLIYSIAKAKAGAGGGDPGVDGEDATSYWLVHSAPVIVKTQAGAYLPATLSVGAMAQTGAGSPAAYSGRFKIAESADGSSFSDVYTSSGDETGHTHTPSPSIKAIRVRLYKAGGTSVLLDEQIAPIATDGIDGVNGSSFWLIMSPLVVHKSPAGAYTPATIAAAAKTKAGPSAPADYPGRFKIAESADGSSFSDVYSSASDEASKTHTPSAGIKSVRVRLYQAGAFTTLLDEQIVQIVADGASTLVGILSNQSHLVTTAADGSGASFSAAGGQFIVLLGGTDISTGAGVVYSVVSESGVDVSINSSTGVYTVASMSADNGVATFRAVLGSNAPIDLVYSISKSKQGAQGLPGTTGTPGLDGLAQFTLTKSPTITLSAGGTLTKTTGGDDWNAQAYSQQSFTGGAYASAQFGSNNKAVMFGLSSTPSASASYEETDFQWYGGADGIARVYEGDADTGDVAEPYVAGDVGLVVYDNVLVHYYFNGVLKRSAAKPANKRLFFDSSFHGEGVSITAIAFGPAPRAQPSGTLEVTVNTPFQHKERLGAGTVSSSPPFTISVSGGSGSYAFQTTQISGPAMTIGGAATSSVTIVASFSGAELGQTKTGTFKCDVVDLGTGAVGGVGFQLEAVETS